MTYHFTALPSGLRVASEQLPGAESVAVVLHVNVGARYESAKENGISHLLEHMAFKGTSTRSAKDIAEAFDNVGGQINAYTSMEHTVYYARVLKQHLELAVDVLCDIIQHSTFEEKELAREKGVILQEIAMNRDSPDEMIADYFDQTAFPGQPLGRPIIGNEKNITSFTRDHVQDYMRQYYTPGSKVLCAAGHVDHDQLLTLVKKYFHMEAGQKPQPSPQAVYHGGDTRVEKELEQLHFAIGLLAISAHDERHYAFQVFASILGGGMSSRLFQEVREKRGLAYSVDASCVSYADCGMLSIYAGTAPERAAELSGVLCEEVARMAAGVTYEELERAKNQLKASLLMTRESPQSVALWISRHLQVFGEYRRAEDLTRRIDAVSKEDLRTLGELLLKSKLTVAGLGPTSGILPYDQLSRKLAA